MQYNALFEDLLPVEETTTRVSSLDSPPTSNQSSPYYTSSAPEPLPPQPTTPIHSHPEHHTPNSNPANPPGIDRKTIPCPYNCTDITGAPRMFSGTFNVRQHVTEKHTKTRPYRFRICGVQRRGFNRQWCLNRHLRQIHKLIVGPGRGRGRKSRAKTALPTGEGEDGAAEVAEAPPRMEEVTGPAVAAGNFAFMPMECYACKAGFGNREEMLMHLHVAHDEPPSPYCSCSNCVAQAAQPEAETRLLLREGGFDLVVFPLQGPVVADAGLMEGMDGIVTPDQMAGEFEGMGVDDSFAPETQLPSDVDTNTPTLDPDLSDTGDDADDLEMGRVLTNFLYHSSETDSLASHQAQDQGQVPAPESEFDAVNFFHEAYHPNINEDLDETIMSGIENIKGFTSEELAGAGLFTFSDAAAEGSTEHGLARL
ncbi:hypothetical protein LTR91_010106 [Friedmanniomyces endolithicus]|uniref:C2H2-type domain-containing protein n=1 Tax=Friedmanniomyces endolithicus TaxID=329885 RepID=A0AAN6KJK1_9PEZI|nr:hypothetical protein LTR59_014776 [Friedmanniomyces endolithicus]KAK0786147.1 hypothetical protein LTR38_012099 [Friedmanniomyces endolithicus]KAK0805872.1 hypothetical protein LTR75_007138 [Friedmanniomyces endolithicus]KAK0854391.1 hypothetical protein LTR03_002422 [Friedmanniomyces endolithicus]KAK0866162.1 hypothetical protein LTS02_004894 [Friedmanniomyces endolithicus]